MLVTGEPAVIGVVTIEPPPTFVVAFAVDPLRIAVMVMACWFEASGASKAA